ANAPASGLRPASSAPERLRARPNCFALRPVPRAGAVPVRRHGRAPLWIALALPPSAPSHRRAACAIVLRRRRGGLSLQISTPPSRLKSLLPAPEASAHALLQFVPVPGRLMQP